MIGYVFQEGLPPFRHVDPIRHFQQILMPHFQGRLEGFLFPQYIESFGAHAADIPGVSQPGQAMFFQVIPGFMGIFASLF